MPLRAVIFDVDGTLVQSMERHYEAYRRIFAERGVALVPRDVFEREGKSAPEVITSIAAERNLVLSREEVATMASAKQREFYSFGPLPFYPGARELIARLHARGLKLALVTGTWRRNVEQHFGELLGLFDVFVAADDVKRTKPDPEPYLLAVERLRVAKEEAVVVENAPLGLRSGLAAGIRVFIVLTTLGHEDLPGADAYFPDVVAAGVEIERLVDGRA